jgi:hypothetical protein
MSTSKLTKFMCLLSITYTVINFISSINIVVIANDTIREIGTDEEIGIGMGMEEMVVATATEYGDF